MGLATGKMVTEEIMQGKITSLEDITNYSPRRFYL